MPGRYRYYKRKLYFSTRDRILLHLLDFVGYEDEFNRPDAMTQFGIADSIGLGRSTVSKAIRRLTREKIVKGVRAHVPSGKLRRTVYQLTDTGVALGNRRRREVEEDIVLFRDGQGLQRKLRVAELPKLLPEYATLLDVVTHVSEGVFDATTFHGRQKEKFVDLTERVPRLRYFFGREEELAAMDAWLASPTEKVLVVSGLTGIGKTTLLARKLEAWKGHHHLFFHRLMEWTTLRNVVQQLAEFLTRLSKKHLAQYLQANEAVDVENVVSVLAADLEGVEAILVYDDYHSAEPGIRNFFYSLRAALETIEGPKLLVAGRTVPAFYDRREVRVKGIIRELHLAGLDRVSSEKLLQLRNVSLPEGVLRGLLQRTGGHPLFLELVDSSTTSGSADIERYLQEELFSRITEEQKKILSIASVFRLPVPADALYIDEDIDPATVRALVEQALIREMSPRVYEVHDVLRSFFLEMMTPHERKRYHRWAAQMYASQPSPDSLEALYHFVESGDHASAARIAVKEGRAILKGGRSEELLGLLEKLLPSVEDSAHSAELILLQAHVLNVRGELDQAVGLYGRIIAMPPDPALEAKVAEAHRYLGDIFRRKGDAEHAEAELESAQRVFRSLEHGQGLAETALSMGALAEDRQDFARAERYYDRAFDLARTLGVEALQAETAFAVSRILAARGDFEGCLDTKRKALAIAEGLADWYLQAKFHVSIGATLQELKRFDESLTEYERGIDTARRIGDLRMLAYGLWNAAGSYLWKGDLLRAEAYLKESEALFRKLHEPVMEALVVVYNGHLWEKRGKWPMAKRDLLRGLEMLQRGGFLHDFARQSLDVASLLHKNGETTEAVHLVDSVITLARSLRALALEEEAQLALSQLTETEVGREAGRTARNGVPS